MALRKPLVVNAGVVQQLQAGDTLDAAVGGGDIFILTNNNAGTLVICTPVFITANDAVDKAKADASATKDCIGLVQPAAGIAAAATGVILLNGVFVATTGQWDAVFGTAGGLTKGVRYYLSAATAGIGTSTAPTAAGQFVVEIGIAISTTEMLINPCRVLVQL